MDSKNTWTALLDSDGFYDILELDLKSTYTTSDFDWFYDILDLGLKNNWINLLDSDWFYYNQIGTLLEKPEKSLELFLKQLVIQSSLENSIFLGQTMFGVWKTKC